MHTEGERVHMNETEASAGSKEGVVRWVLIIGTVLAILILSIIWITGATLHGNNPQANNPDVNAQIEARTDNTNPVSLPPGVDATNLGSDKQPTETDQTTHQNGLSVVKNDGG